MGLDAYITKGKKNYCPHCNEFIKVEYDTDEFCYWRENWDLHNYIDNGLHTYGINEYGKNIELSIDDLIKIKKFENKNNDYETSQNILLDYLVDYLKEDVNNAVVYSADW